MTDRRTGDSIKNPEQGLDLILSLSTNWLQTKGTPLLLHWLSNIIIYYCYLLLFMFTPGECGSAKSPYSTCSRTQRPRFSGIRVFYRPNVLPVTQQSVSKYWRKHKVLTPTTDLASSLLHLSPYSWRKACCSLHPAPPMPVPSFIRIDWLW